MSARQVRKLNALQASDGSASKVKVKGESHKVKSKRARQQQEMECKSDTVQQPIREATTDHSDDIDESSSSEGEEFINTSRIVELLQWSDSIDSDASEPTTTVVTSDVVTANAVNDVNVYRSTANMINGSICPTDTVGNVSDGQNDIVSELKDANGATLPIGPDINENSDEEFYRAIEEYNRHQQTAQATSSGRIVNVSDSIDECRKCSSRILLCERSAFDPSNELRQMFGSLATDGVMNTITPLRSRNAHTTVNLLRKKLWIYSGETDWPFRNYGLSMDVVPQMSSYRCVEPSGSTTNVSSEYDGLDGPHQFDPTFDFTASQKYIDVEYLIQDAKIKRRDTFGEQLTHILRDNPFHIETCLVFAQLLKSQGEFEYAVKFIERALFALQLAFHPRFSPFTLDSKTKLPQVALNNATSKNGPRHQLSNRHTASFYKVMIFFMKILEYRGSMRASLEVAKLILSTDTFTDKTHLLLHIDFYALRSRSGTFLSNFVRDYPATLLMVSQTDDVTNKSTTQIPGISMHKDSSVHLITSLDYMLPNFAYSTALGLQMERTSVLSFSETPQISVEEICQFPSDLAISEHSTSACGNLYTHHVALLRALLLFPAALNRLLFSCGINVTQKEPGSDYSWKDILFEPPFVDTARFAHKMHGAVICENLNGAFATRCASLWKTDVYRQWLQIAAAHLVSLYKSPFAANIFNAFREEWSNSEFIVDLTYRYSDVKNSEFEHLQSFQLPSSLLQPKRLPKRKRGTFPMNVDLSDGQQQSHNNARHLEPEDEHMDVPLPFEDGLAVDQGLASQAIPSVSLYSDTFIVFLQLLLPWNTVDQTGLFALPTNMQVCDNMHQCYSYIRRLIKRILEACKLVNVVHAKHD